ncbi:MAG: DUF4491 family protein [Christensenellales bacterium]
MNFIGIIVGAGAFLIIGLLHPVVIWVEYYLGKKVWILFLGAGLLSLLASLVVGNTIVSCLTGVLGFSLLWSIRELFEQEKRVKKGWYPARQKRQAEKVE